MRIPLLGKVKNKHVNLSRSIKKLRGKNENKRTVLPSEELDASVDGPPSQLLSEANPFRQGYTLSTRGPLVVKLHKETRSTGELLIVPFWPTETGKLQSL